MSATRLSIEIPGIFNFNFVCFLFSDFTEIHCCIDMVFYLPCIVRNPVDKVASNKYPHATYSTKEELIESSLYIQISTNLVNHFNFISRFPFLISVYINTMSHSFRQTFKFGLTLRCVHMIKSPWVPYTVNVTYVQFEQQSFS